MNDLTGQHFGRLTVIRMVSKPPNSRGGIWWRCKCSCGRFHNVAAEYLRQGKTKSCGCLKKMGRKRLIQRVLWLERKVERLKKKDGDDG